MLDAFDVKMPKCAEPCSEALFTLLRLERAERISETSISVVVAHLRVDLDALATPSPQTTNI